MLGTDKKKAFYKVFVPLAVAVILITILLQVSMYGYFVRIYSDTLRDVEVDVLGQKSNNLAYLTETIRSLNSSIGLNYTIMSMCYQSEMHIYDLIEAQQQLDTIRVSSDLIHSVYLLNPKTQEVHVSSERLNKLAAYSEFQDQEIFRYMDDVDSLGTYTPVHRIIYMEDGEEIPVLTFFFYDYFIQTGMIDGIVIINVPMEWLEKRIVTENVDISKGRNELLVVDEEGRCILDSGDQKMGTDLSNQEYMELIKNNSADKDSITCDIEGEKSLVSYYRYGNPEWTFVDIKSYDYLQQQLQPIWYFTLLISLVILSAGLLIVLWISRRLADHYERIARQMRELEAESREHLRIGRTEFIRGLLKGERAGQQEDTNYEKYEMATQPDSNYILVLFEIDRFTAFGKSYHPEERNQILHQMMEIIHERMRDVGEIDVEILAENQIVALCDAQKGGELTEFAESWIAVFEQINEALKEQAFPQLSVAVSSSGYGYAALSELYNEVTEQIQYRYILGQRSYLFPGMFSEKKETVAEDLHLDVEILNALGKGKMEEAMEALEQYLKRMETRSPYEIRLRMVNLVMQMHTSIIDGMTAAVLENYNINHLIQEVMTAETLEETRRTMEELFVKLIHVQEEKNKGKYEVLIKKIREYVSLYYAEENLSINLLAEKLGFSVGYLGRLFKKIEGRSVSEYIMAARLGEAEKLLKNSSVSVNTIAQKVGFVNNSYFYSVFKKVYGVTPSQWRVAAQEEESGI